MTDPTKKPEVRARAGYWDAKIRKWAGSSYTRDRGDMMSKLRTSIDARKEETKRLLREHLEPGYSLLDLGCGSGHFAIEAVKDCGARQAVGLDFSAEAIDIAHRLRAEAGLTAEQAQFRVALTDDPWPATDVVTGLGLLDWLEEDQIDRLFSRLTNRRFIISFSEQDNSFDEIVHRFYLVYRLKFLGNGVRAYHHRRQFILDLAHKYGLGPVEIESSPGMRFGRLLHNLSADK
jgi:SAM-dependent methyltransferase